jgi:hypothetical protein
MMAKVQTLKVSFAIGRDVKQNGFACRDEGRQEKCRHGATALPLGLGDEECT